MKRQRRRHRFLRGVLALATMTGAASFAFGAPAEAKPISIVIGRPAVLAFCTARGGTYASVPGFGYSCTYIDRDGKIQMVTCPENGLGCEFVFAPPNRPKSGAAAVTIKIDSNAKLEPQQERELTTQILAEQARSAKAGKAK